MIVLVGIVAMPFSVLSWVGLLQQELASQVVSLLQGHPATRSAVGRK